ncbi:MAG: hypothetical protein ABIQ93_11120 [Saprospiraceae bacterium]
MQKKLTPLLSALICLFAFGARAQFPSIVESLGTPNTNTYNFSVQFTDGYHNPPLQHPIDVRKAQWAYFWMFSDGYFSTEENPQHRYGTTGEHSAGLSLRGRYTDDPEPPHAMRKSNHNASGTANENPFPTDREVKMTPQWNAARGGDTVYLALRVKNWEPTVAGHSSGQLLFLYPSAGFEFLGELFNRPAVFGERFVESVEGTDLRPPGTLCRWSISNYTTSSQQTMFLMLKVKGDTSAKASYSMLADLQWSSENPQGSASAWQLVGIRAGDKGGNTAPNIHYFITEDATDLMVNRARDPSGLVPFPAVLPPGFITIPYDISYRGTIINEGDGPCAHLRVAVGLDQRLESSGFDYNVHEDTFPPLSEHSTTFTPPTADVHRVEWIFKNVSLLAPVNGDLSQSTATFRFKEKTQKDIRLREGDRLICAMNVQMFNADLEKDDEFNAPPSIIEIRRPGRLPYGGMLGLKFHTQLHNADSLRSNGLSLTLQCPLFNPRGNRMANQYFKKLPSWFWQFELGFGRSAFNAAADGSRYATRYIHVTPIMLRYARLINVHQFGSQIGASAGYSADYIYDLRRQGAFIPVPGAFGRRLEQEVAVSLDLLNLTTVPGLSVGVGYKWRFTRVTGTQLQYHFPFLYAQLNLIRFRPHFAQVLTKTYRW